MLGIERLLRWMLREALQVQRSNVRFSASAIELRGFVLLPRFVNALLKAAGVGGEVVLEHGSARLLVIAMPWAPALPSGGRIEIRGLTLTLAPPPNPPDVTTATVTTATVTTATVTTATVTTATVTTATATTATTTTAATTSATPTPTIEASPIETSPVPPPRAWSEAAAAAAADGRIDTNEEMAIQRIAERLESSATFSPATPPEPGREQSGLEALVALCWRLLRSVRLVALDTTVRLRGGGAPHPRAEIKGEVKGEVKGDFTPPPLVELNVSLLELRETGATERPALADRGSAEGDSLCIRLSVADAALSLREGPTCAVGGSDGILDGVSDSVSVLRVAQSETGDAAASLVVCMTTKEGGRATAIETEIAISRMAAVATVMELSQISAALSSLLSPQTRLPSSMGASSRGASALMLPVASVGVATPEVCAALAETARLIGKLQMEAALEEGEGASDESQPSRAAIEPAADEQRRSMIVRVAHAQLALLQREADPPTHGRDPASEGRVPASGGGETPSERGGLLLIVTMHGGMLQSDGGSKLRGGSSANGGDLRHECQALQLTERCDAPHPPTP